ncbi:MAG: c-type cytochrome biogenesis protein CcmI [Nevskia sp.]|nr:c-type cytochrome biogenesis protein CcmI [Nevskia sp.]
MSGWASPTVISAALMAALLLLVAAIATRPWWGGAGLRGMRRRNANVAAFRTRLDELAQERQAGLLAPEDAQALQNELGARLLAESTAEDAAAEPAAAGRRLWPAAVLTVALAVFAGGWYALAGGWQAQRQIAAGRGQDQQVEGMVAKLAERLRQQPDDATGWGMLGRSYFVLQRFNESAKAYAEANARTASPNPEWLAGQGEALAFARDRDLQGTPAQLFDRALAADPKYGKALWYAGLAAAQAGDADKARGYWEKLAADPDLAPQMREVLQARLQEIGAAGEAGPAPGASAGAGAAPATAAGAAASGAAAVGTVLNLNISVDDALAGRAPPDAVLFVFAKAAAGPPMPLAVQRLPGAHLPLQVRLDDSMAMAPALSLSQFDKYLVTARLSRGGTAQAQSGDLEGSLQVERTQAGQPLALRIDHAVP